MLCTRSCLLIIFNSLAGFFLMYVNGSFLNNSLALTKQRNYSFTGYEIISNYSERNKRFLFLFPFYRILPGNPCTSSTNLQGVCLSQRQCNARGGICSGSCAGNRGVCCVYQRICGQSSNANITYFVNQNFPSSSDGGGACTVTINKLNSGICQLRLDFLEFNLAEPNNGVCNIDSLSLGIPNFPSICGMNGQPGQHVYIDLNPSSNSHTLTINTLRSLTLSRRWNIQVSQIACNNSNRAPFGCLKYYTGTQGSDYTFNYSPEGSRDRQIANLNYGVCVRPAAGYCSIQWSQASGTNTFSVSGDTSTAARTALTGTSCTSNYIVIPNPVYVDVTVPTLSADRFCGTAFNSIFSSTKPFAMTVVTGPPPSTAEMNKGFHLRFTQIACP